MSNLVERADGQWARNATRVRAGACENVDAAYRHVASHSRVFEIPEQGQP